MEDILSYDELLTSPYQFNRTLARFLLDCDKRVFVIENQGESIQEYTILGFLPVCRDDVILLGRALQDYGNFEYTLLSPGDDSIFLDNEANSKIKKGIQSKAEALKRALCKTAGSDIFYQAADL